MASYLIYLFYAIVILWIYRLLVYFYDRDARSMRKTRR